MKGIDVAVADPIDPICVGDNRQSVKGLIKEHMDKINKIRSELIDHPLYDLTKHDDLWILRFYLSHKKIKQAVAGAKYTLEFRKEHKLDEVDIRSVSPNQVVSGKVREYLNCWNEDAMVFAHPHPKRGVICFMKLSSMDQHKVVETLSEDYWLSVFMYCSEWFFQWLDHVTRITGLLTKSVRFVDLSGYKMNGFNRECSRRDGKAMELMEDCYPQLLECIFVVNAPLFIDVVWKVFKLIIPKRVIEKFDIIKPFEKEADRKKLIKYISNADLPDYLGGKNTILPHEWETSNIASAVGEKAEC
jgi:CRAL/TRIO domain